MVFFFKKGGNTVYAVLIDHKLSEEETGKLAWLFGGAKKLQAKAVKGTFVGPRREMIAPWSTNAVEITQNMGIHGITRIEEYQLVKPGIEPKHDKMLQRVYHGLNAEIFATAREPTHRLH